MLSGIIFAYAVTCAFALYVFISVCIGMTAVTLKIFTVTGLLAVTLLWPVVLPAIAAVLLFKKILFKS